MDQASVETRNSVAEEARDAIRRCLDAAVESVV